MATKSQLKQYFETGRIPTQAQFGELIDFVQPLISDNVSDRPNQTLRFGGDGTEPIVNGLRIVHYYENDDTIYNYWIFTNEAGRNNQSGISIPMFVIKRISSKEPNLSLDMPNLEYTIPTREQLTDWVQQGYDCDTAYADTLHSALTHLTFKPWSEGGGSEFPRVAYIDSQSAWDTWYNNFKTAYPESGNSGGSGSPTSNRRLIDGYTFIIGTSGEINFQITEALEFLSCTIINNGTVNGTISMNFVGCVFKNCYLSSNYRIINGEFNSCSLLIDGNISNATINDCNLHGHGSASSCDIRRSDVKIRGLIGGDITFSNIQDCNINNGTQINGGKLYKCNIYNAIFTYNFIEMIGCRTFNTDSFRDSSTDIKGFIFGCDFSTLTDVPGTMKGVQCCKFKSTLLSSGSIRADLFGNKSAASNGMNTGI